MLTLRVSAEKTEGRLAGMPGNAGLAAVKKPFTQSN
jgi:hypothetical protein